MSSKRKEYHVDGYLKNAAKRKRKAIHAQAHVRVTTLVAKEEAQLREDYRIVRQQ
jgi:hypothetical protein